MGSEVEVTKSFEDKLKDKIKNDIGTLLTDEDLSKLVKKSLNEVFFDEREIKDGYYSTKKIPPLIHELIKTHLSSKIDQGIKDYLSENNEEVMRHLKPCLEQSFGTMMISSLNNMFGQQMMDMQYNVQNMLQQNNINQ